jgi:hypothetical protein
MPITITMPALSPTREEGNLQRLALPNVAEVIDAVKAATYR